MGIIGLMLSLGWHLDFTMAYLNSYSGLVIASIASLDLALFTRLSRFLEGQTG